MNRRLMSTPKSTSRGKVQGLPAVSAPLETCPPYRSEILAFGAATCMLVRFVSLLALRPLRRLRARKGERGSLPQTGNRPEVTSEFGEFLSSINFLFKGEPGVATELQVSEQRAIKQARLYEALSKTNQVISIRLSPVEMFEAICRICVATKVASFAWIGVLEDGVFRPLASAGSSGVDAHERLAELGSCGPTEMALREGVSSIVEACASPIWLFGEDSDSTGLHLVAAGAFPIMQRNKVTAVLTLYCPNADAFDGTLVRLIEEMTHDVSFGLENHQRERELHNRELQLDAIVETAMEAIVTVDASLKVVVFNGAACHMFGWTKEQVVGCDIGCLLPSATRAKRLYLMRSYAASKPAVESSIRTLHITGVRASGQLFPLKAAISRVGVAGETLLTAVVKDMTGVREAADERISTVAAQTANRAKTDFLSRMSHELRTPLNAVTGFAQLLAHSARDRLDEGERHQLGLITAAGSQLGALIDDVLDVSRIEAGHLSVYSTNFFINQVLDEVLEFAESAAAAAHVQLVRTYCTKPNCSVRTDTNRLRQVLSNLVSNAIKYNRPGGLVEIDIVADSEYTAVRVKDSGIGMSAEQLDELFQPFNRLGQERGLIAGTGIGLVLSRQLVNLLGGSLDITSVANVGTEAVLRLANLKAISAHDSEPATSVKPTAGERQEPRGTVLYIEDNPVNVLIVQEALSRWNDVELLIANDGQEGMRIIEEASIDLVLLDMYLPNMSGMEVLSAVRNNELTLNIPMVALSASAMNAEAQAAIDAGANEYWTKPIDFPRFFEGVATYLRRARAKESANEHGSLGVTSEHQHCSNSTTWRPADASPPGRKKLVLVADDHEDAADCLSTLLDCEPGFAGMAAIDGEEALTLAFARRPDAAILDIDMPRRGGIETARLLRQAFGESPPLLIALTGRSSLAEVRQAAVFDHVLRKPADIRDILSLLETI